MSAMDDINSDLTALLKRSLEILIINALKDRELRANTERIKNFNELERKAPSKIKNADIDKRFTDAFIRRAEANNIKALKIVEGKDTNTIKYSLDDEHKISDIFKEIEEKGVSILDEKRFDFKKGIEMLNIDKVVAFFKEELKGDVKASTVEQCIKTILSDFETKQNIERRITMSDIEKMTKEIRQEESLKKNSIEKNNNQKQEKEDTQIIKHESR